MKIDGKKELIALLEEISNNCGDNRGRDGEYMGDEISKAIEMAENLSVVDVE